MAIQAAGIEIKSSTIGLILQEKNLCVPLSQRSYRWEAEHVDDLYKGGFKFQVQRVNDGAGAHRLPGAWRN